MQMQKKLHRYECMDGLRAFGCIAILVWHVFANSEYRLPFVLSSVILPSFNDLVYLFMLISGFGIFNGYYEKMIHGGDIVHFYKRRYCKLLPFFSCLILVDVCMQRSADSLVQGLMEATMLFGLVPKNGFTVIGVAWTLGVIFVFYLLFPYFVFLFSNKRLAWISFVGSLFISTAMENYFLTPRFGIEGIPPKTTFLYCMPFFALGGILYLYRERIEQYVSSNQLFYLLVCLALTLAYYLLPEQIVGVNVHIYKLMILFGFWLTYAMGENSILLKTKPASFLSSISMEVYLSHMVAFRLVEKIGVPSMLTNYLGNGICAYLLTCGITIFVVVLGATAFKKIEKEVATLLRKRTVST